MQRPTIGPQFQEVRIMQHYNYVRIVSSTDRMLDQSTSILIVRRYQIQTTETKFKNKHFIIHCFYCIKIIQKFIELKKCVDKTI